MADSLLNLTNVAGLTPAQYGVGPVWPNGVQHWGDGVGFAPVAEYIPDNIAEIHKRIYSASIGATTLNYILTGDSIRAALILRGIYISQQSYAYILDTVGVTVDFNSASGMTSEEWRTDSVLRDQTFTDCIALISGTGANSIVEYSLGQNDWDNILTDAQVKANILAALDALIAAKPDIAILLIAPIATVWPQRSVALTQIYNEVAAERSLPLVSGYDAMVSVYPDPVYYVNDSHPTDFGTMRMANYIINHITPATLIANLPTADMQNNPATVVVEAGRWIPVSGVPDGTSTYRRLQEIPIPFGATELTVVHQGDRNDLVFMTDGVFNYVDQSPLMHTYTLFNVTSVRINISYDGPAWDALNDTPTVVFGYLPILETNKNLQFNTAMEQLPA